MNHHILSISLFFIVSNLYAQDIARVKVSGQLVAVNDVEGVTIFNNSSKNGTVADFQGNFSLEVALNDVLEISALQYETNTVIVNQDVLNSNQIRLFLVDKVNTLSEVLLLPSQLSGNLLLDIENAKVAKNMAMNFGDLSQMEFPVDEFTKVDNEILIKNQLTNGLNFAAILGLNKLVNRPLKKRSWPKEKVSLEDVLTERYTSSFYIQNYKIPCQRVNAFIRYVVSNGLTEVLLKEDQEFMLLECLQKKSLEFLKQEHE
ncbi:MAG: carboxypeptidase-like regulatory domain-containing protein [Xanthomarina sp.]